MKAMNRSYTLLWRKIWANPLLCHPSRKFSRLEAWFYIINVLAARKDDESAGLKRGEFAVSVRYLAKCFNWSHGMTQRFLDLLLENSMISRAAREAVRPAVQEAGHFIVCNYDAYNQTRYTERYGKRYAERYKIKEVVKEGFKEVEKDTHGPAAAKTNRNGGNHAISSPDFDCEPGGTSTGRTSRGDPIYRPRQ